MNWNLLASLRLSFPTPALMVSEHTFLFRLTRQEGILGNKVPAHLTWHEPPGENDRTICGDPAPGRVTWCSCACCSLLETTWLRDQWS